MLTRGKLTGDQYAFLQQAALAAQHARAYAWSTHGKQILASVAVAQAIRETGWGRHTAGANNYFGLKAGKSWIGLRVLRRTWEILRGKRVTVTAAFRAYKTMDESFRDYARHLCTSAYYRKAVNLLNAGKADDTVLWTDREGVLRTTPRWEAYARLVGGTWATDPAYGDAICELIRGLVLRGFDQPLA